MYISVFSALTFYHETSPFNSSNYIVNSVLINDWLEKNAVSERRISEESVIAVYRIPTKELDAVFLLKFV